MTPTPLDPAQLQEVKVGLEQQRRRWMWTTAGYAIAFAMLGPLVLVLFVAAIANAMRSGDVFAATFFGVSFGSTAYHTWRAGRFARRLAEISRQFSETADELKQEAVRQATEAYQQGYQRGIDESKAEMLVMLRQIGQSFADSSGAVFEIEFHGNTIVCEPADRFRRIPYVKPVRH